jgi:hypothetical protein
MAWRRSCGAAVPTPASQRGSYDRTCRCQDFSLRVKWRMRMASPFSTAERDMASRRFSRYREKVSVSAIAAVTHRVKGGAMERQESAGLVACRRLTTWWRDGRPAAAIPARSPDSEADRRGAARGHRAGNVAERIVASSPRRAHAFTASVDRSANDPTTQPSLARKKCESYPIFLLQSRQNTL